MLGVLFDGEVNSLCQICIATKLGTRTLTTQPNTALQSGIFICRANKGIPRGCFEAKYRFSQHQKCE